MIISKTVDALMRARKGILDAAFSQIRFGCNFHDNLCERARRMKDQGIQLERETFMRPGCCCGVCCEADGYLHYSKFLFYIPKVAQAWDTTTGFFRKGCGCSLPLHLRNAMCLTHSCRDVEAAGTLRELGILREIIDRFDGVIYDEIVKIKKLTPFEFKKDIQTRGGL